MKTLTDYIKAVQLEEGTDLHAQAEAHLSKANDADAKGDNYGYHMHMTNHHEALSQWHDSKGRGGLAAKHEDLAAKHEDKAEDAREASSKRGVKEAYDGLRGNVGDRSKREFKHRELEHELGHEVNPRATFSRPSSSDVPHAVHIDGKKWKTFGSQSHATNVARKIPGATVHKEEYVAEGSDQELVNRQGSYWDQVAKEKKNKERDALKDKKAEHEKTPIGKAEKYWAKEGVAEGKPQKKADRYHINKPRPNFKRPVEQGVAEEYAVKHKETGKTLSTHDNEASAKDEHEGLGDDKSKYKVIKTSSAGKQFKMHEGN